MVPDDGDDFYLTFQTDEPIVDWVQQHVIPYLDMVPDQLECPRLTRKDAAHALERYLAHDKEPVIFADWPEDVAQFCTLLMTAPGGYRLDPTPV